jgi:hypothetical protein
MIWGKRDFDGPAYGPYQDRLQQLLFAHPGQYREFIMVATDTDRPGISTYWVGVPSEILFTPFDGFERVKEAELPKEIDALLVADATKEPFTSRFKFKRLSLMGA